MLPVELTTVSVSEESKNFSSPDILNLKRETESEKSCDSHSVSLKSLSLFGVTPRSSLGSTLPSLKFRVYPPLGQGFRVVINQ